MNNKYNITTTSHLLKGNAKVCQMLVSSFTITHKDINMKYLLFFLMVFSLSTQAQVGIGTKTPAAGAILDLHATDKALLLPRVALTGTNDVTTVPTPVAGMVVYNTADAGGGAFRVGANKMYFHDGTKWKQAVDNDFFQQSIAGMTKTSILGYTPVPASQKATVATAPGGATVTLVGCKTNPANGHVYCAYQLSGTANSGGTNFYDTFRLAKQIGGYIVTMTSNAERIWVNDNILASGTGYNLQNNIWIGYNKVAYPGNPLKFVWITGEDWRIDWTTSPNSTPENWFNAGEPNNQGGNEGSCHIWGSVITTTRRWNDLPGASTFYFTGSVNVPFNQVIIEFDEP